MHRQRKHVALAAHGLDAAGLAGVVAQALAQAADQQVDGAVEDVRLAALGEVKQLLANLSYVKKELLGEEIEDYLVL